MKEEYISAIKNNKLGSNKQKEILISQVNTFFETKNIKISSNKYNIGDEVVLKKGTLLHGTYKNLDGLKDIVKNGLMSSLFTSGRGSKYPASVGVWNLNKDYTIKEYVNFYSGGTIKYYNLLDNKKETKVIPFNKVSSFINEFINNKYQVWKMEQTKEARFLPSLVQDTVQIGIIFNGQYAKELLKGDILNPKNINDKDVEIFVNKPYYEQFIKDRLHKDDFFTNRESAILFGIPSNLIEGILVGKKYEKDKKILKKIKELLPNAYIANLDGIVIY